MAYRTVDPREVEIALERVDGATFEKFAQQFYGAIQGTSYVPLGGVNDGGAEGFDDDELFADERPGKFMQASVQGDARAKIRKTVARLKEFGRSPTQLIYVTSQIVPHIDPEEEKLGDELGLSIKIRDGKYIAIHLNDSPKTIQAYDAYLAPILSASSKMGSARIMGASPNFPARDLYVFLGQEVERRRGNTQLLEAVTDSLILWSLENTDPDKGIFLTREEILHRVIEALPASEHFIRGVIDTRLSRLASKDGTNGRSIRWYRKEKHYCLPFETREIVKHENLEDELLRQEVSDSFRKRAITLIDANDPITTAELVVKACHKTLEKTFESQGLELANFVNGDQEDQHSFAISEHLKSAIEDLAISGKQAGRVAEVALQVLRSTFYDSTEAERSYLGKMSRTYIMMFILRNDIKIVDYFRNMAGTMNLYVGSDIVIRSLSERYLHKEDQMTVNMLEILKASGSNIILTEKCAEEVWTHLKATDAEFQNHYADMEPYIDLTLAQSIDRILIRSYFYARIEPLHGVKKPAGWKSYIGNFCEHKILHSAAGYEQLRKYLIERFKLAFETADEMADGIEPVELAKWTSNILSNRKGKNDPEKEKRLAENDALQVLRVYHRRQKTGETNNANPYGYRTWWLTQDAAVRRVTGELVVKHQARFMMRPEFLLHFIALAPSEAKVRKSYERIFPTLLGIRLSNRLDAQTFKTTMAHVKEAFSVDDAMARVRLEGLSNQLKSDFLKQYEGL